MEKNNIEFQNFKKKEYYPIDSCKVFFYVILAIVIASLFSVILFAVISYLFKNTYTYSEFDKLPGVIYGKTLIIPVTFLLLYFFYSKKNNINMISATKFKPIKNPHIIVSSVILAFVSVFAIGSFIGLFNWGLYEIGYRPSSIEFEMDTPWKLIAGIFSMALLPAVAEELLFRGIILQGLMKKYSKFASIIMSAIFFMLMHGALSQTLYQFYLGIILAVVVAYGGSIFYGMILHFLNNLIVLVVNFAGGLSILEPSSMNTSLALKIIIPLILLIVGIVLTILIIKVIKSNQEKNPVVITSENVVEISSQQGNVGLKHFIQNLNSFEKVFFNSGMIVAVAVWLMNTIG